MAAHNRLGGMYAISAGIPVARRGCAMVNWVFDAGEVEWMTEHLANFWDRPLAATAPTGFPAYGRLLHPARAAEGRWMRWADVAAYNGVALSATSDFRHIAMP